MHHVDFAREDVDLTGQMAGSGRRIGRRALARPDPQSRKHADRCSDRRSGDRIARTLSLRATLINGRLVRPLQTILPVKNTYWIVCPKATFGTSKDRRVPCLALAEQRPTRSQLDRTRIKRASARVEAQRLWRKDR